MSKRRCIVLQCRFFLRENGIENDLFEKMTVNQQEEFYSKICKMQDKLAQVEKKTKRSEACSVLVEIFGEDFPVKTDRSYVGHSESA